MKGRWLLEQEIPQIAREACSAKSLEVTDGHTHLFSPHANSPKLGAKADEYPLCLHTVWQSILYHYVLRTALALRIVRPDELGAYSQAKFIELAVRIWDRMFVEHKGADDKTLFYGLDQGCEGLLIAMKHLGYDPSRRDIRSIFEEEANRDPNETFDRCMKIAGVNRIIPTNTPFDPQERRFYLAAKEQGFRDPRFGTAFRLDPLTLFRAAKGAPALHEMGYDVHPTDRDSKTIAEARRFLDDWFEILGTLGPTQYAASAFGPKDDPSDPNTDVGWVMKNIVLPFCRDKGLRFFLMPGAVRQLQPTWSSAGDGVGLCDMAPYQRLVYDWSNVEFFLTVLHAGNQYDATVLQCHNANVMNVGHWWFNLTEDWSKQVLRERLDLLGTRFVAFNSDARNALNLVSKWLTYRSWMADVLTERFQRRVRNGLNVTQLDIEGAARALFPDQLFKLGAATA